MTSNMPTNQDDIIDSRDIIEAIENYRETVEVDGIELDDDMQHDYDALLAVSEDCNGLGDWEHGETLVRESYFETYAREIAEELCYDLGDQQWPLNCIDWEQAARELQWDYTTTEFDGVTYYIRNC